MRHVENMIETNRRFNNGGGSELFLFTDKASLRATKDILKHSWTNGRGEKGLFYRLRSCTTDVSIAKN